MRENWGRKKIIREKERRRGKQERCTKQILPQKRTKKRPSARSWSTRKDQGTSYKKKSAKRGRQTKFTRGRQEKKLSGAHYKKKGIRPYTKAGRNVSRLKN